MLRSLLFSSTATLGHASVLIYPRSEMVRFHLLTSIFISLILIHNTNPSKEIRADDAEESKRVAVRIPGENIGPNFHSDLNLLPQQSQMLYGVKVLKRETFDYYKWPKDGNAGLVNVPYRVSRTSYFCKYFASEK